jgi:hypothetical protein
MKRLLEFVQADRPHYSVDAASGVVRDVLLVKRGTSKNGRLYTEQVLAKAKGLYEGAACYGDHGTSSRGDRSMKDKIGWISGVYLAPDGLRAARLNLLTTHPLTSPILEAARRNPKLFGLSHNILGETRRKDGIDEVTVIESVVSVDVVSEPSSTNGLQESRRDPPARSPAPRPKPSDALRNRGRAMAESAGVRLTQGLKRELNCCESIQQLREVVHDAKRREQRPSSGRAAMVLPADVVDGRTLARWATG